MSLLVLGSVAFDDLRTPSGFREKVVGGSATYFAWAASTLVETELVAAVGHDFPEEYVNMFRRRGIGIDGLARVEDAKTFYWKGSYGEDLNEAHTDSVDLNVLESWKPVVPADQKASPFVFLANDAPANQLHALEQIQKPKLVLCDTRDLWIDQDREGLLEVMRRTDGIILNDGESVLLTGDRNVWSAARKMHEMGSRIVVIKRGEYGAYMSYEGRQFAMPSYPVEKVVDPTGAGDTFAGGLLGYLALLRSVSFFNLRQSMLAGTTTASFCVEDFSLDRIQNLQRDEFEQRLEALRNFLMI